MKQIVVIGHEKVVIVVSESHVLVQRASDLHDFIPVGHCFFQMGDRLLLVRFSAADAIRFQCDGPAQFLRQMQPEVRPRLHVGNFIAQRRVIAIVDRAQEPQGLAVVALEHVDQHRWRDPSRRIRTSLRERVHIVRNAHVRRIHRGLTDQLIDRDVLRVVALQREEPFAVQREIPSRIIERGQTQLSR